MKKLMILVVAFLMILAASAASAAPVLGCASNGAVYEGVQRIGTIKATPVVACDNDPVTGRTYFITDRSFGYWTAPDVTTIVATYPSPHRRSVDGAMLCLRANDGCFVMAGPTYRLLWVKKTDGTFIELGMVKGLRGAVRDMAGFGGVAAPFGTVLVLAGDRLYNLSTADLSASPYAPAPALRGLATDCSGGLVTARQVALASCVRVGR